MDFGKHESIKLQNIFSKRPFQIQEPEKAKIIFLGLDANIDKDIEKNELFFNEFFDYIQDGVKYWKNNGIHTPMLKTIYRGAGKKYHENFCKLGFTKDNAEDICFIELLNIFTYGNTSKNNKLFMKMLTENSNKEHLNRIKDLVKMNKTICLPKGVNTLINELGLFKTNSDKIIIHTHFSNAISNNELINLGIRLRRDTNLK